MARTTSKANLKILIFFIAIGFGGFGLFGYAAFPMSLELAVEESYPIDASISEACVHIVSNSSAIFLVLLGKVISLNCKGWKFKKYLVKS